MARLARLYAAVGLMAGAIASACSLTSLDGFAGGDGTDAGALDQSSSDAATSDAVAGDADANVDGAPTPPFCTAVDPTDLALCADFDGKPLPAPFSRTLAEAGGSVTIDGTDFRSSPGSVVFAAGRLGAESAAGLAFTMKPIATQVSFDMDVRIEALGKSSFDVLSVIRADVEIGLQITEDGALEIDREVPDGDGGQTLTEIPVGGALGSGWRHIRMEASPKVGAPSTWDVRVLVDGAIVGATTVPSVGFVGQPDVVVGDDIVFSTSLPWRIRVDNVAVRAK